MTEDREVTSYLDILREHQVEAWERGERIFVEALIAESMRALTDDEILELIFSEVMLRTERGDRCCADEYLNRFPEFADSIKRLFALQKAMESSADELSTNPGKTVAYEPDRNDFPAVEIPTTPSHIGRYRVEKILGKGGFGLVYLAHDDQLQRLVAIKVSHRKLVDRPEDAEAYLTEARAVANLDHPNIVPVHDVGSTSDFPCYIVSKFIDGSDLATKLKQSRLNRDEAVELVATVAEALHYAHKQGLVHRDIKPGNLLIDTSGKPFVADFGLALREQDAGKGPRYAGTPAYMSPEQARGEGHRVDGRSDIFSLGVVLYELLAGRRPFKADSKEELLEQITSVEVRPPRQVDDNIPKEIERICLKALTKRASERYTTAKDLADDLRHFRETASVESIATVSFRTTDTDVVFTSVPSPVSEPKPMKIVPKGLRSFDAHDADFFLDLLPGPRDRDGLPASIRFWKTRLEEIDSDETFSVGLIYGPSGCGKSSLVKAGLLPRLSKDVISVYVEATAEETETRLLNGLRKRCLTLPEDLSLKKTLAALRRGQGIPVGRKVVIVLDQFEQWLHAKKDEQNTDLVQALRQCDGGRVQCIVMVRDDFWLAVSRFLKELEVKLVEDQNSALVDLFDVDHARRVLAAFGRAFGKLPEDGASDDQMSFLEQAISGLSQEGKVISVRLSLFAEMMKGKSWTPATLKEVGGTEGVGVTFLEETFSTSTAPPEHRYHQKAARAVLRVLLPESGTEIKGHMRSHVELLEASGYSSRANDFNDLIRILDSDLRLITPTDPEGHSEASTNFEKIGEKYYQLTHDYLVPSLRDWLTRKQKETRRGRAELLLADRAAVWNVRPENRQLPSLFQLFQIRWWTHTKNWTGPQQKMMHKSGMYYALRSLMVVFGLVITFLGSLQLYWFSEVRMLRDRLQIASEADVPDIVRKIDEGFDRLFLVGSPLFRAFPSATKESEKKQHLRVQLVWAQHHISDLEYIYERLLTAEIQEVNMIVDVLTNYRFFYNHNTRRNKADVEQREKAVSDIVTRLWTVLENPKTDQNQKLRAACALSGFASHDPRWEKVSDDVAAILVMQNPFVIAQSTDALYPVGRWLLPSLEGFLVDEGRSVSHRGLIATVYNSFAKVSLENYDRLENQLVETAEPNATVEQNVDLAKKQASIGLTLMVICQAEKVWPLLKHSPDPTLRSYLIDRLAPAGVDPKVLFVRLEKEQEVSVKRAILLSLGEYGNDRLSLVERQNHVPKLMEMYRDHPDPGIHGAAEFLLRKWEAADKLEEIDKELATGKLEGKRQWYLNRQGQTMVVIPRPEEFWIGEGHERHKTRIDRNFAIASKEVTVDQFLGFLKEFYYHKAIAVTGDCPMNSPTWYHAALYCNWLSNHEGIPKDQWCYVPLEDGKYEEVFIKMADNFLQRTGYRLPTEAEWEYACRTGADTGFSFGDSEELLGKYAWFAGNSLSKSYPVGSLRSNDLGLFDMHGNILEWCQDDYGPYGGGELKTGEVENLLVKNKSYRVLRGGSFIHHSSSVRSATRFQNPAFGPILNYGGFRLARTLPPEGGESEKTDK